ncbi:hypothetical protein C811_00140 [Adlercreutzia caecimuris B7]|uniref:Glycosyltransferase RgtA/B/C/D-like domain-containing protein n=1 Tax=Adlercreutzia caecimuris B7 TaxID=1235794 RepID=R9L625_9ACTN|nr:hypothetical protein C811_00140 [Adlercreutzia caecimuris B7]
MDSLLQRAREAFGRWGSDASCAAPCGASWCCAAAATLAVALSVLLIFNDVGRGPDDDLGIAMVLSGLYPDSGQCPFTNALLNNALYGLNLAFPAINWTLLIERLSALVALFAAVFVLLRSVPPAVSLTVIGFLSFLIYPLCTVSANFTVVGALCVFSGEVLIAYAVYRGRPLPACAGIALAALGFMWRSSVFLLSLPFFLVALAVPVLSAARSRTAAGRKLVVRVGVSAALVLAVTGGLFLYNQAVWTAPELASWQQYSHARSQLCDYPVKPYDDIASELDELRVSENDYWCMTHWVTADPDFFTAERLQAVANVAAEDKGATMVRALKDEARALLSDRIALLAALVLVGVVVGLRGGRRAFGWLALSAVTCFAVCVYFRWTGRFPIRVEYPAWMFSLMPVIACFLALPPSPTLPPQSGRSAGKRNPCGRRGALAATVLGVAVLSLALGILTVWYGPTMNVRALEQFQQESQFADSRPLVTAFRDAGGVSVWDPLAFAFAEQELRYRSLPPRSFMEHTAFAGGWTTGSALKARHDEEIGVANPLRSLVERRDVRFVTSKRETIEHVRRYLEEHCGARVESFVDLEIPVDPQKPSGESKMLYAVSFHQIGAED